MLMIDRNIEYIFAMEIISQSKINDEKDDIPLDL